MTSAIEHTRSDAASPLRIEMALPTLESGGMETVVARLAVALHHAGHDVGITCTIGLGPVADWLRDRGITVTLVPTLGLKTHIRAPSLIRWFRQRRPDVVHVHSGAWLKAANAARAAGVARVVYTCHGLPDVDTFLELSTQRIACRLTDNVVAVSSAVVDYVTNTVGVPHEKVRVVLNGIDTEAFRPVGHQRTVRETLGLTRSSPVVAHVARLSYVKNQTLLIDAFALVLREEPDAVLIIAGDGPDRAKVMARIAEHGIGDSVRLLGDTKDTAPIYRAADVFVLCSLAEGTSISILEALASGTCVVATAVGGTPALLDHGRCGVLVPPSDPAALATAVLSVLRDTDTRDRLVAAGFTQVRGTYSQQAMLEQYEALYRGTRDESRA